LAKYVDALKYPRGGAIERGESDGYACAGALSQKHLKRDRFCKFT
jgi:hypothetical protein